MWRTPDSCGFMEGVAKMNFFHNFLVLGNNVLVGRVSVPELN